MAGNKFLKTLLRENTKFLLVSFLVFSSEPAILYAQSDNPYAFTEPLTVSRGNLMPSSPDAEKVPHDVMCNIVTTEWGWTDCDSVDSMVFLFTPEIDTLIIDKPDTSGYVVWMIGKRTSGKTLSRPLKTTFTHRSKSRASEREWP